MQQSKNRDIEIFIFSFNRGMFLENCIKSAEKFLPFASITIIDDESTDLETKDVLKKYSDRHSIVHAKTQAGYLGGLRQNMQLALGMLAQKKLAIFIQDDMQFVRPVEGSDLRIIDNFFGNNKDAAFLYTSFLKYEQKIHDEESLYLDAKNQVYFRENKDGKLNSSYYSDVGIVHIERLRKVNWKFQNNRYEMFVQASKLFSKMGFYAYPFMMYLPSAPTTKNKEKTLALRLVEWYYNAGFYPYLEMEEQKKVAFLNRDLTKLPIADRYLRTSKTTADNHFEFRDSLKKAPFTFRRIDYLEKRIRKLLQNRHREQEDFID